jgi:hypothetical protein
MSVQRISAIVVGLAVVLIASGFWTRRPGRQIKAAEMVRRPSAPRALPPVSETFPSTPSGGEPDQSARTPPAAGGRKDLPPRSQDVRREAKLLRSERRAEEERWTEFWEDLQGLLELRLRGSADLDSFRQELLTATSQYLQLGIVEAASFETAAVRAAREIEAAWGARNDAVERAALIEADREERSKAERAAQAKYEEAKGQALERLRPLFPGSPRQERFLFRLEAWVDAFR